jgi:hypothetical protein
MPTTRLTPELIAAAIDGYEFQKTRIDTKIAELRSLLTGGASEPTATPEPPKRKRRRISAAGRKAIAEAQRKRWAASKKAAEPSAPEAASKPKRKLSAAGRRAISAATKKRWAAVRAAKAQQEKATRKAARNKAADKKVSVKAPPAKAATEAAGQ